MATQYSYDPLHPHVEAPDPTRPQYIVVKTTNKFTYQQYATIIVLSSLVSLVAHYLR